MTCLTYNILVIMENPDIALELTTLVHSLINSSKLLHQAYIIEIKVLSLVLLAWVSFKLGKKTVVDPLEEEVKQMKTIMATRDQYTIVIPNKIKSLGSRNTVLFVLLILSNIAYFAGKHFAPEIVEKVDVSLLILGGAIIMLIILLTWFYQLFLKFKLRRGNYNDQHIINKIGNIVKMLGSKAQTLLKYFLCKDAYNKYKIKSADGCNKQKCKQYRALLEQKFKGVANLVGNAINFEWCTACKRRPPFDEYLDFQGSSFNQDPHTERQDDSVNNKNNYLLKQIEKMAKWVKDIGPCNCSMRYWYESKKEISQFKRGEKQLNPKLAEYEEKKK